jgi:5-methylcytosine-specific restriction endonuclease McrA
VCSSECKTAKLRGQERQAVERDVDRRRSVDKGAVRSAVVERDGNFCLLCGSSNLHLHRVRYGSEGGQYNVGNCVLLCDRCHLHVVHGNKKVWQPMLLAHLAKERGATQALRRQLRQLKD